MLFIGNMNSLEIKDLRKIFNFDRYNEDNDQCII